jgi:hypothetical protein
MRPRNNKAGSGAPRPGSVRDLGRAVLARPAVLVALASVLLAAVVPSSALANTAHSFARSFGAPGEGAGQLALTPSEDKYPRVGGSSVAVDDETHDVYVADTGNNRVDEFEADGTFIRAWGFGVADGISNELQTCELTCFRGLSGAAPGELDAPMFIAVDNDPSSLSHGDVYVAARGEAGLSGSPKNRVSKFSAEGDLIESWGVKGQINEFTTDGSGDTHAPAATGTGDATINSKVITGVVTSTGAFAVGQHISVPGSEPNQFIFTGTTITEVGAGTITLSGPIQHSSSNLALSTEAETITDAAASSGEFAMGQSISGPGIPAGAVIRGVEGGTLFLSANATASASGVTLTATGPFGRPGGIAVDGSGNLWVFVGENPQVIGTHMYEFEQGGNFVRTWYPAPPYGRSEFSPYGIGVDGAGNLYISAGAENVNKYSPSGGFLGAVFERESETAPLITGLAVDPAAPDVYVDLGASIEHFSSSCKPSGSKPCEPVETFGAPTLAGGAGLTVDSSNAAVYAANTTANQVDVFGASLETVTGAASNVLAKTVTVSGTVNPEGTTVTECYFEYGESEEYEHRAPCEAPNAGEVGSGHASVAVHADLSGLQGATTYHYRLVVANAVNGRLGSEDRQFSTPPTPLIANAAAGNVALSSADLSATVNPLGAPLSSCTFEYGTSTSYGSSVACAPGSAQIGAGNTPVHVSAALSGLTANTEYHWRLVATNANGSSEGTIGSADHTFVYSTVGSELPDGRAYEMVSPPAKNGASIGHNIIGPPLAVSENGSRVLTPSIQCFADAESCTGDREQEGELYELSRTSSGWVTSPTAPPASTFFANSSWEGSADDGTVLLSAAAEPGSPDHFYARHPSGPLLDIGPVTPPGTSGEEIGANVVQATADLSHVVYGTSAPWPFDGTTAGENLYEYSGTGNSEPFLVPVSGSQGSTELIGTCGADLGNRFEPEALSADGKTVVFSVQPCQAGGTGANAGVQVPVTELFARIDGELPDAHTVAISEPMAPETRSTTMPDENCTTTGCQKNLTESARWMTPVFEGASADDSKVFFLSGQQLTDQATQGSPNLYEYDFTQPAGHDLLDLSAGDTSGVGPGVSGVMAVSLDGTHVYFTARGVLTAAQNAQAQTAIPGQQNLYVYERDAQHPEGRTAFIATLPAADEPLITGPIANTTPDGRFLVFESHGRLTPDVTRSDGAIQVFRYAAQTETLTRISIGDMGFDDNGNAGTGNAEIVPADVASSEIAGRPRDRTMSNDGAYVFFQSPIALTPGALDDIVIGHDEAGTQYAQNVYEYHEGRVYLISGGHDVANARTPCKGGQLSAVCLLGTDATGANVFFTTTSQLVPADTDTQLDIYDARICTAVSPCISPAAPPLPPCLGEACHGIPGAAPTPLSPGTATFDGEGNLVAPLAAVVKPKPLTTAQKLAAALKACRKDKARTRRTACERSAHRRFEPKSRAKKANRTPNHRRTAR